MISLVRFKWRAEKKGGVSGIYAKEVESVERGAEVNAHEKLVIRGEQAR
jgi:hypothetical protein